MHRLYIYIYFYSIDLLLLFLDRSPSAQVELLQKADFRAMPENSVAKSFPTLHGAGAPVSKVVWARTFVPWLGML